MLINGPDIPLPMGDLDLIYTLFNRHLDSAVFAGLTMVGWSLMALSTQCTSYRTFKVKLH